VTARALGRPTPASAAPAPAAWHATPAASALWAEHPAAAGHQRAFFLETGEVSMPRYERAALAAGQEIFGPALIEDDWSTIVVYPGQRAAADLLGNLIIDSGR